LEFVPGYVWCYYYPAYWAPITEPKDVTKYKGDYHIRRIWSDFNYTNSMVVDPASVGTAIATGKKSAYKAVGLVLIALNLKQF
jgi:alkaline phosphatase